MRYGMDYERAFQLLHRYSNDNNIKLRELAQHVLELREMPAKAHEGPIQAGS
jgi:AmiR/NasT family two-component response regulator